MKFNYQARTKQGEIRAGIVEASSREAALSLLQKQGFYVTYLEEEKVPFYAQSLDFFKSISRKEVVLFSRQLSMMFTSKIPLVEALRVLSSQTKNPQLREKIMDISVEVEGGSPFSKALARHPEMFSTLYIAMVKAGEESGKLADALNYLADHLEREYELMSEVKGALTYPLVVLALAIAVIFVMIYTVVPQLRVVLEESQAEIPLLTRQVLSVSEIIREYGVFVIAGFCIALIAIFRAYKTKEGKKVFDKISIRVPLVGDLMKTLYLSRLGESLSTLISGGLMIGSALELSSDIVGNALYKDALLKVRDEVRRGTPISSVLTSYPNLFSPLFVQMTLVGERTGQVDNTLMKAAEFYQGELERGIDNLIRILEPALIIFLGVVVGGVIFSVLMPLYQSMNI